MSSGKCKLKQQWDTTTHLLEWPKSKILMHEILARMWSNRSAHPLLVGMQNATATLQDGLAVSYKTKHSLNHMIQQSCSLVCTQMN